MCFYKQQLICYTGCSTFVTLPAAFPCPPPHCISQHPLLSLKFLPAATWPCSPSSLPAPSASTPLPACLPWPSCSYLVLFLKFIASVVPTIEYDYTMAAGGQQ